MREQQETHESQCPANVQPLSYYAHALYPTNESVAPSAHMFGQQQQQELESMPREELKSEPNYFPKSDWDDPEPASEYLQASHKLPFTFRLNPEVSSAAEVSNPYPYEQHPPEKRPYRNDGKEAYYRGVLAPKEGEYIPKKTKGTAGLGTLVNQFPRKPKKPTRYFDVVQMDSFS